MLACWRCPALLALLGSLAGPSRIDLPRVQDESNRGPGLGPHNDRMNSIASTANRPNRLFGAFCLALTLALLACRMPYRGLRHDAVLYFAQALARLNPAWAAGDFYFAFGSQDRYSLFSLPRAWLLAHASTPAVDIAGILAAWGVFVCALIALARDLSPRLRWLGVLTVVAASHFYGPARIFGFLEPFLTARTLAEPFALVALLCLLRGRRLLALAMLGASLLMHPLIACPMAMVFFCYLAGRDRRWGWALALLLPIGGLALAGIPPFSALLRTYDDPWWQAVLQTNQDVVMSQWHLVDVTAALANLGVLALASRGRTDDLARSGRAALVAAVVLCVVSYVGGSLLRNVLILQLQLWRVMWIVDVLALLQLPLLLAREWQRGPAGQLAAIAVFGGYFCADSYFPNGWAIVAWATVALIISGRGIHVKRSVLLGASVATVAVVLGTTGAQIANALGQLNIRQQGMAIARASSVPFVLPVLVLPTALGVVLAWERGGPARLMAAVMTFGLLAIGVGTWDQRTPWERYVEGAQPGSHPFAKLIPPGTEVYWHGDTLATWLLLQRPQFISLNQVSGVLFNRETAYVAVSRLPYLMATQPEAKTCDVMSWFGADSRLMSMCRISREGFFNMCKAEPIHPGFLVASVDFGTGVVARWRFRPDDGSAPIEYVLYDCGKIR